MEKNHQRGDDSSMYENRPVYVEEAGKYLIGKTEISDSADIYSEPSLGLCLGEAEEKIHSLLFRSLWLTSIQKMCV